jgi:hypothetical protein
MLSDLEVSWSDAILFFQYFLMPCAKNGSPVHDPEKSGPRGLLLVHVHPRAVSGAADDNGERSGPRGLLLP